MKYFPLMICLLVSAPGFAGVKESINKGAQSIDQGTRKVIKSGKTKWREHEQRQEAKKAKHKH